VVGALAFWPEGAWGRRRREARGKASARAARCLVPLRERRLCPGPHDVLAPFSLAFAPARERRAALYCEERAMAQALQMITDRRARPSGVSSELGRPRSSLACIASSSDSFAFSRSFHPSYRPTVRVQFTAVPGAGNHLFVGSSANWYLVDCDADLGSLFIP
jgi:hypothetical protein